MPRASTRQRAGKRAQPQADETAPTKRKIARIDTNVVAPTSTAETAPKAKQMEKVINVRKRKNQHEYLVQWKNNKKAEWISRDIAVTNYPQYVIAYFQDGSVFENDQK